MKKIFGFMLFFVLLFVLPVQLSAAKILYYVDTAAIGEDSVVKALKELSSIHKYVIANTKDEFESEIAQDSYDLVILSIQDKKRTTLDFPSFVDYVGKNGKVIFSDANRDGSFASLLGFAYTSRVNQTSIDITDDDLKKGVTENPFSLYNPGYITWSMGLVPAKRTMAVFSNGDAAVIMTSKNITINGYLVDTLSQPSPSALGFTMNLAPAASGSNASTLVKNTISYTLNPPSLVPPVTVALAISMRAKVAMALLFAFFGVMAIGRNRKVQAGRRRL